MCIFQCVFWHTSSQSTPCAKWPALPRRDDAHCGRQATDRQPRQRRSYFPSTPISQLTPEEEDSNIISLYARFEQRAHRLKTGGMVLTARSPGWILSARKQALQYETLPGRLLQCRRNKMRPASARHTHPHYRNPCGTAMDESEEPTDLGACK